MSGREGDGGRMEGRTRHNERSSQPIRVSNGRVGRELISLRESCFRTRERERERERRRECTFRLVEMTRGDDRENMNRNFSSYLCGTVLSEKLYLYSCEMRRNLSEKNSFRINIETNLMLVLVRIIILFY